VRRIIVTEFVSLDGVMDDPGGGEGGKHGPWTFQFNRGAEGNQFKVDELFASEALLLGRVTYQGFASAWPGRTDEAGFADRMNSLPKYVVSTTLTDAAADATWNNSKVIRGDVVGEIGKLKKSEGGDILVEGSARLVQTLMEHGLVDELRLMVFPIVLGSGRRLFGGAGDAAKLELTSSKTAGDGILLLTYKTISA
jgi:dihydrofolate reductase